jgi:uncharacterized membrane protein YphA (DoxX/SURF4 family)
MTRKRIARLTGLTALWLITLLEALSMIDAGWGKFESAAGWQHWFVTSGYAAWFATVIGLAEIGGGLLLLVPKVASYAALLLMGIMLGAFYTVTMNESDLSWVDPLVHATLLGLILLFRWPSRLHLRGTASRHPKAPTNGDVPLSEAGRAYS